MSGMQITKDIVTSFAGTLLALLSACLVWLFKSGYEKHKSEKVALAKFERIFVINIEILKDNFEFIDEWVAAVEQNRPFSFHFEDYNINEEETYKISNLKLINQIFSINYKLRRTGLDISNMYKSYWEIILRIDAIQDQTKKENSLNIYHNTVKDSLKKAKLNYEPLKDDLINVIALVRAVHKIRFHSFFGYVSFLFADVFPIITKKSIENEVILLKKNIERKEKGIK